MHPELAEQDTRSPTEIMNKRMSFFSYHRQHTTVQVTWSPELTIL